MKFAKVERQVGADLNVDLVDKQNNLAKRASEFTCIRLFRLISPRRVGKRLTGDLQLSR